MGAIFPFVQSLEQLTGSNAAVTESYGASSSFRSRSSQEQVIGIGESHIDQVEWAGSPLNFINKIQQGLMTSPAPREEETLSTRQAGTD